MAYDVRIGKHATAGVSKLLATYGGAHIYNVTLSSAADNGNIIKRGDYDEFETYKEATATTFNGKIIDVAANGNFYVEVLADMGFDALLVYNVPMTPDLRYTESTFYNEAGDIVRAHTLCKGDVFEVSAEAFSGTPEVGKTITTIADKKLVIA